MLKYPDTEQFRHCLRNVQYKAQYKGLDSNNEPIMDRLAILPKLKFQGTVKIHGGNLSAIIDNDNITCQSRNNIITIGNDCYGFAKFISELPADVFTKLKEKFGNKIAIYGEWAGKGIQDTVAVSKVDKFWSIFAIRQLLDDEDSGWIDFSQVDLTELNKYRIYSIYQFGVYDIEIDFEHPAESVNKMNEWVLNVEKECPVGKFFGVSSVGEGIVFSCKQDGYFSSRYVFKVKGSEHSKSRVKKLANVDVEKMKSIEDFVEKHLSEERLNQGIQYLNENKIEITEKSTGDFIRWVFNDLLKEEIDELTASNLTAKDLGGAVAKKAKIWYFTKLNAN